MEPVIVTEKLTRVFGQVTAVENVNFQVFPGEVFGFLGPNGAGKTTTIRMLSSLIAPSRGSAVVCGYRVGKDDTNIRQQVGLLTETPGLYLNLSAEHNLNIFARLYEIRQPEKQVEKYLKMLGLYERRMDSAGTFSKGMKQKLAIARALIHEPRLIFLDEPTSGLDPEAAHIIRDFIAELRSQGRTIILCTHNLDEADRLCDRIAVIKNRIMVVDSQVNLRATLFGHKIVFHLKKTQESYAAILRRFPFARDVQMDEDRLLATVEDPDNQNPHMVSALVAAGAEVMFVGEIRKSLEDVYLHLIKEKTE